MHSLRNDKKLAAVVERLEKQFPHVPRPGVEEVVMEAHDAFSDHPIKSYVPGLVERHAKERLLGWSAER